MLWKYFWELFAFAGDVYGERGDFSWGEVGNARDFFEAAVGEPSCILFFSN
jgi:hypothetical protein